jgi:hypothetical protein
MMSTLQPTSHLVSHLIDYDHNPQQILVYDAPWYQPVILPSRVIVHPALKTRACNAKQVTLLVFQHALTRITSAKYIFYGYCAP